MSSYFLLNSRRAPEADPITALIVLLFFGAVIAYTTHSNHEDRIHCRARAVSGDHYADPITKTCGVIVVHRHKSKPEVAAPADCAPILDLEEFADVRHCFTDSFDLPSAPDLK